MIKLVMILLLVACSRPKQEVDRVWSIEPKEIRAGKERTFVVNGREMNSAEVIAGESVEVLDVEIFNDATIMILTIRVHSLADDLVDVPGRRKIVINTKKDRKSHV